MKFLKGLFPFQSAKTPVEQPIYAEGLSMEEDPIVEEPPVEEPPPEPRVLPDGSVEHFEGVPRRVDRLYKNVNGVLYECTEAETLAIEAERAAFQAEYDSPANQIKRQLENLKGICQKIQMEYEFYLAQLSPSSEKLMAMAVNHGPLYDLLSKGAVETAYTYLVNMTPDIGFSAEDITFFKSLFLDHFPQLAALG